MRNFTKTELAWIVFGGLLVIVILVGAVGYFTADEGSDATPYQPQTIEEELDAAFVRAGFELDYPGAAYEAADAVCMELASGGYPSTVARTITRSNYRVSDDEAMEVVEISIRHLCPKFTDRIN